MGFFIATMLIVLPLFLYIGINMLKQSEVGKTGFGKFIEFVVYVFMIAALATGVYLITLI